MSVTPAFLHECHAAIQKVLTSFTVFVGLGRKAIAYSRICNPVPAHDKDLSWTPGVFVFVAEPLMDTETKAQTRTSLQQLLDPASLVYAPADRTKAMAEPGLRWIPSSNLCNPKLLGKPQRETLQLYTPELLQWTSSSSSKTRTLNGRHCAAVLATRVVDAKNLDRKDEVNRHVLSRLEKDEEFAAEARPYDLLKEYVVLFLIRTPDGKERIPILKRLKYDVYQDATEVAQDFILRCYQCEDFALAIAPLSMFPTIYPLNPLDSTTEERSYNQVLHQEGMMTHAPTLLGFDKVVSQRRSQPQDLHHSCRQCGSYFSCTAHLNQLDRKHHLLHGRKVGLVESEWRAPNLVGMCMELPDEDNRRKATDHAAQRKRRIVRNDLGIPVSCDVEAGSARQTQFKMAEDHHREQFGVAFDVSRASILFGKSS